MKLRIKGDTLRLRLLRSEVQRLVETCSVEETVHFAPGQELRYALRMCDADAMTAEFDGGCITVRVPAKVAAEWAAGDMVGLYAAMSGGMTIAVEKDFACVDRDDEERADSYPNPKEEKC